MHTSHLRKVGGSIHAGRPARRTRTSCTCRREPRSASQWRVGGGVIEPQFRRRYTLDELLAQCDPKAARTKEDREWVAGGAAGAELI